MHLMKKKIVTKYSKTQLQQSPEVCQTSQLNITFIHVPVHFLHLMTIEKLQEIY